MSSNARVARRYAEALLGASVEARQEEAVAADLEMLSTAIRESRDFRAFLKSPVIKREKKLEVVRAAFEGRVAPLSMEFLLLLAEKGREGMLAQTVVEFRRMRNERLGIVSLGLSAATELSKEQSDLIRKRFEELTKKTVRVEFSLDPALIGGFRARMGDTVYDGSVQRQLELLRLRFAQGDGLN